MQQVMHNDMETQRGNYDLNELQAPIKEYFERFFNEYLQEKTVSRDDNKAVFEVYPYANDIHEHVGEVSKVKSSVNLPLKTASKIVSDILSGYSNDREEAEEMTRTLEEFIAQVLAQKDISGSADDWHNLAVDIARNDYFGLACDVLEIGLEHFPKNADLIGDYLQYGISCGRIEQCHRYYKRLAQMPKNKYTWRSFHFSIDWLIYLWEQDDNQEIGNDLQTKMQELVRAYRKFYPTSEDSYICDANVRKLSGKPNEEEKALLKAVDQNFPAPKCALRLADIYFSNGQYQKSLNMVLRSINDSNQTQPTVNEAYLFYLAALARISLLNKGESIEIAQIYNDFENSLQLGISRSFRATICQKAALLSRASGTEALENYIRLYNLLADQEML